MDNRDIINQEINRLSIQIACVRYDWEFAVKARKPVYLQACLAQEIQVLSHQRKCLQLGRYNELPYNIKLLYNASK